MASITLAEAQKLSLDDLVIGVIENIVEVNPIYRVLPFQDIDGNAKTYNRENALGNVQVLGINGTITAKAAPTYTKVTTNLTTIIGDAEVNGLIQAQRVGGDVVAQNIASKAKNVGRTYQNLFFNGDPSGTPVYSADEFEGLDQLAAAGQIVGYTANSAAQWFQDLDETLHAVKSKDGQVDALAMSPRDIRIHRKAERALGGTTAEYVNVAGVNMPAYAGVPIYRSDWIRLNSAASPVGSPLAGDNIYALNFDDGSEMVGVAGLTATQNMGVHVQPVGPSETADNDIYRVKFYASLAVYSALSLAILQDVLDYE